MGNILMLALIKREYDYAIRICAYLAGRPDKQPTPISYISKILAITKPIATKITHKLNKKGIIGSVQGRFGGIFLIKDPNQLSILDILKAMDFDSTLNECILNPAICPLVNVCHIHVYFTEQERLLLENFDQKKIAELAIHDGDLATVTQQPTHSFNTV